MARLLGILVGLALVIYGAVGLATGAGAAMQPNMSAYEVWFVIGGIGVMAGSVMG